MHLHFRAVTMENRQQAESLSVFPEQMDFIESVAECLKEADETTEWNTVGIYDDDILIGFAMYGYFQTPLPHGEAWLDRVLIDKAYQGKGYGKAAVFLLLKKMHEEYACNRIYLSVFDKNQLSIHLYKVLGFDFNGEYDAKGERIMVYDFK